MFYMLDMRGHFSELDLGLSVAAQTSCPRVLDIVFLALICANDDVKTVKWCRTITKWLRECSTPGCIIMCMPWWYWCVVNNGYVYCCVSTKIQRMNTVVHSFSMYIFLLVMCRFALSNVWMFKIQQVQIGGGSCNLASDLNRYPVLSISVSEYASLSQESDVC